MRLKATSLVLFLLLLQWSALGAPAQGQITGINIAEQGWIAQVTIYQMPTNGWFDFGNANSNHTFTTTNFYLSVTSQGWDDACNYTTIVRSVRGTLPLRFIAPNQTNLALYGATNLSVFNTTNGADYTTYHLVLDDYIHAGDSNITATVSSSLVTASGVPVIATNSMSVTNSSTMPYPRVIAHWSWPGGELVTTSTITNRVMAFNQYGRYGRPVRAVKFFGSDANGNSNDPVIVTNLTLVQDAWSGIPIQEYVAVLKTTNFANNTPFTNYFQAYPWVGDFSSVYDSSAVYHRANPEQFSAGLNYWRDTNDSYGTTYCIIDPVNGNTNSGSFKTTWNLADLPSPFPSFREAQRHATLFNRINHGRTNVDNTYFYLTNGTHGITNLFTTSINYDRHVYGFIEPFPGLDSNSCPINKTTWTDNNFDLSSLKFTGLLFDFLGVGGNGLTDEPLALWMDGCTYAASNSGAFSSLVGKQAFTRNRFYSSASAATSGSGITIHRGNYYDFSTNKSSLYQVYDASVFVGNLTTNKSKIILSRVTDTSKSRNWITAFNYFVALTNTGGTLLRWDSANNLPTITNGVACVGNLIEGKFSGGGVNAFFGAPNDGQILTNQIIWNNTSMGGQAKLFYLVSSLDVDYLKSVKNNIFDGLYDLSSDLTNCWPALFSVGSSGNLYGPLDSRAVFESYGKPNMLTHWGWQGVNSYTITNTNNIFASLALYDPRSRALTNNIDPTVGDYHPTNGSPAFGLVETLTLPYDFWGSPRYVGGPSGALEGTNDTYPPTFGGRVKRIWLRNFHH